MSKQQVALASRSFLVAVIIVVVVVAVVVVVDGYLSFLFPPAFNFDFDLISINYTRYELAHSALLIVPSYHQSVRRRRKKKTPLYAQTAIRIYTTCSLVSTHSHVHLCCSVVINAVFFLGASGIPNRRCIENCTSICGKNRRTGEIAKGIVEKQLLSVECSQCAFDFAFCNTSKCLLLQLPVE